MSKNFIVNGVLEYQEILPEEPKHATWKYEIKEVVEPKETHNYQTEATRPTKTDIEKTKRLYHMKHQTEARNSQVGGGHYAKLKIQPLEYSYQNNLGAAEHTVIKYVTRWRDKGGVEDLRKARHTLDLLIEMVESSVNIGEENERRH